MYFDDMANYRYFLPSEMKGVLTVGWLDSTHAYCTGEVDIVAIDRLRRLICGCYPELKVHVNQIRGQHPCNLSGEYVETRCDREQSIGLGSSEIWIPAGDRIFAAPSMILHYIEAHSYLPPPEFLSAIQSLDETQIFDGQQEYERRLEDVMQT